MDNAKTEDFEKSPEIVLEYQIIAFEIPDFQGSAKSYIFHLLCL